MLRKKEMKHYDPKKIEGKWQKYWDANGTYRQYKRPKKRYVLDMFPYPSGAGLHVGHPKGYIASDVYARFKQLEGYGVLHPMGWDAFGLPAEQYAIKNKVHPEVAVKKNITTFKKQLGKIGFTYDWEREINTTDPEYYKWTQWIFLQMFHNGLAYQSFDPINWCPSCQTGLANEDLEQGRCERCDSLVEKRPMRQWVLKITAYADKMLRDLKKLDWPEGVKLAQKNWIGRSEGAEVVFYVADTEEEVRVFTTRLDTIYGCTYVVVAPEHVSADGSAIIFSEVLEGASIFSFDPRTGVRSQLTAENTRDITPSISTNGQLAFARVSLASSYPWLLSSILLGSLADGRLGASRILRREGWNPVLSPSGRWLTYLLQPGNPVAPHLNLLNVESGHSREIAEMPLSSRTFMAFPWFFVQRDIHWSSQEALFLVQAAQKEGSRILRFDPRSGEAPQRIAQLKPGEMASSLVSSPDGSRLFYVRSAKGKAGGAVLEIVDGHESQRYAVIAGEMAILGHSGSALIIAEEPLPPDNRVRLRSIDRGSVKELFELDAMPSSLRFIPGLNSISFSRRDSREVENVFLKRLDTLTETMVSANGIQGVSFSPVSNAMGSSILVFSQQQRNKDLGIIRLDRP